MSRRFSKCGLDTMALETLSLPLSYLAVEATVDCHHVHCIHPCSLPLLFLTLSPDVFTIVYGVIQMSSDILRELDWCLMKLEGVSSTKSMGNMANEKFRRLLSRELTTLSEGSKEGAQVAEWVTNLTNLGESVWSTHRVGVECKSSMYIL